MHVLEFKVCSKVVQATLSDTENKKITINFSPRKSMLDDYYLVFHVLKNKQAFVYSKAVETGKLFILYF